MLGANLLESLFVLSFNHQTPQLGLIALTGIMCMSSLTVGAHVKGKTYQRRWLRLSIAFKVGQSFISSY
jgi:hypothetical protein